jgi:hypothetical protein
MQYSIKVKNVRAGMRHRTYRLEWQVTQEEGANSANFDEGDTFCFDYSEMEWYNSGLPIPRTNPVEYTPVRHWTTVRDEVLNGTRDALACSVPG